MANPWKRKVRSSGKLTVWNAAEGWAAIAKEAINTFNTLGFGVKFEFLDGDKADVVVKASDGTSSHKFKDPYFGEYTVNVTFDAGSVHGRTKTLVEPDKKIIMKAAVFLPNKLTGATAKVKEIVVIHELIHAAGLDDNKDHDKVSGLFYSPLEYGSGKLSEWGLGGKYPPMPPVRIGAATMCNLKSLWVDNAGCD
ncbi:MAG: hypothetical protein DWQ47_16845 [Acidobacteria bacterium]|nr:MAG: hypothetical protein DWQ32_04245 [Acidobacteriota bacterium]REK02289.1 MAG: hypothetical protein DWQ38_07905 [Acidobacteriota bacterium]REK13908.1 MAG: hypothetical protein DWQ43_09935 [Acidobacteriota bacterium]REK41902.1 MAG: hypothetical protein DWQ47_16845 [Acidobacteriota bacterium]